MVPRLPEIGAIYTILVYITFVASRYIMKRKDAEKAARYDYQHHLIYRILEHIDFMVAREDIIRPKDLHTAWELWKQHEDLLEILRLVQTFGIILDEETMQAFNTVKTYAEGGEYREILANRFCRRLWEISRSLK